ncbi:protein ADM2 [Gambusia affinis]|uniref:protein ADM2 n=1 Tax=Gambusia affinis TaxID=33528 RepID=UPI001CDCEF0B|nr:protein ADM2 [Gambusia affinis]XP_043980597.1 protein ADM2 [Gambusia affinis]XP_043980598.1 protein ADM2 [Gambusia affinis]
MTGLPVVWLCLLLSLLPLEIQSRALRAHRHRLGEPRIYKASYPNSPPGVSDLSAAISNQIPQEDTQHSGRTPLHSDPSSKLPDMLLHGNNNVLRVEPVWQRGSRGRRHANSGSSRAHAHLMRVGCVLGTCQVQNLSHRLYQLIGQNGREDFSPINPRSPHSYG